MLNRPKKPQVYIKRLNRALGVQAFSLDAERQLREEIGVDRLSRIGVPESGLTVEEQITLTLEVFWLMLDDEAKRVVRDVKLTKWNGLIEEPFEASTPADKLKMIVSGVEEVTAIMAALMESKRQSEPDPIVTEKKSQPAAEHLAKVNSSTLSQASTDLRQ